MNSNFERETRRFIRETMSAAAMRARANTPRKSGRARRSIYSEAYGQGIITGRLARDSKIAPHFHLLELGVRGHTIALKRSRAFRIAGEWRTVRGGIRHPGMRGRRILQSAGDYAVNRIQRGLGDSAADGIHGDLRRGLPRNIKVKV